MMNLLYNENGLRTGRISFSKPSILGHLKTQPHVISIVDAFAKERKAVEDFIADIYEQSYNAHINVHYPILMSVRDEAGKILAAAGFRYAKDEPLFLEQYLGQGVEHVLQIPRSEIVEFGNLASDSTGASLYLFAALAAYLNAKGLTHAVLTSTASLERRFKLLGLQPTRHVRANPSLLLKDDEDWGSYYDTQPHVISGSIEESYKTLQRRLGAEFKGCSPCLYSRLHYKQGDTI